MKKINKLPFLLVLLLGITGHHINSAEINQETPLDPLIRLERTLQSTEWVYAMPIGELRALELPIKQSIIVALKFGRVIIRDKEGVFHDTKHDWYLTRGKSGEWNYKDFNYIQGGPVVSHLHPTRPKEQQGTGVLVYPLMGLYEALASDGAESNEQGLFMCIYVLIRDLCRALMNYLFGLVGDADDKKEGKPIKEGKDSSEERKLDAIIVSTGMYDELGVSQEAIDYLQRLKDNEGKTNHGDSIKEYYILNSQEVPGKLLELAKKGYSVGTLLHITC